MANFDFTAYNSAIKSAGSGLRLHLAVQLLEDVEKTARRFQNPLRNEISDLLDELYNLQAMWKKQAETAQKISKAAASADASAHGQEVTSPAS